VVLMCLPLCPLAPGWRVQSFLLVLFSEIGDKTFFIAVCREASWGLVTWGTACKNQCSRALRQY